MKGICKQLGILGTLFTFGAVLMMSPDGHLGASAGTRILAKPSNSASSSPRTIRWLVAHGANADIDQPLKQMQNSLSQRSKGELRLEVVIKDRKTISEVNAATALEMVETGQYEMAQIYTTTISSRLDPKFMVFDVPFLFRDHDHASAVIDGPIGAELLSGLDRFGVKGLGFTYSGGYRILTSKGKSIKSLSDFVDTSVVAMGGARNKVISETFEKLGAKPVSGSFAERQKLAEESTKGDVVETTYTRFWNSGEHRRLRTISETYHSMHLTTIVMNKKFFDGLSDNQKKIIAETSKELAVYERQQSIRLADEARDRAKSLGLKVHSVSSEVRNEMMERLRDVGRVGPYPFPRELVKRIDGTPSKAFLADR